ncbi:hypothetical protein ACJMK2_004809 [Sinanodonta woodiana]|uniref:Uncharacterized protein n=1 Tax=Sinanodonta woodiana TaxID=1069815 RepID=A0ABD3VN52_SINWO
MKGIFTFLAVSLTIVATAATRSHTRHRYCAHSSFCSPCVGNVLVEIADNLEDSLVIQDDCPSIPYLMELYINALTNDTVEIREILENERSRILLRHISNPDFIPMTIHVLQAPKINQLIRDIIPNGNYLDQYTALLYGKFIVLASHLRLVESLGIVSPNTAVACSKFGHALCKIKQFRIALGMNTSLSDMCHYNPSMPLYSRAHKIDYSISVLKQGADSLTTILQEIREVTLRETNSCVCDTSQQKKSLVCS